MNIEIISPNDLLNLNKLDLQSVKSSTMNGKFWYYTSADTANKILLGNCFYVSNINVMNDKNEALLHGDKSNYVHALCFCNSQSEKIPMWYLYAGLTGKGISIGLNPSKLIDFINSINVLYTIEKQPKKLIVGHDIDICYGYVFYRKTEEPHTIKYRNKFYELSNNIQEFKRDNYFIKDYPWEYEKEFRIVFKNYTGHPYKKLKVEVSDDILFSCEIRCAPEFTEEQLGMIYNFDGFKKYLKSKLALSKLKINMNLFERNEPDILQYVLSIINNARKDIADNNREAIEKICNALLESGFFREQIKNNNQQIIA